MDKDQLERDYNELKFMKLIGAKYGVHRTTIKYWLVKYGLYRSLTNDYIQPCNICGKEIRYRGRYKRDKVHCSQKCSNRRPQKEETRLKISKSLKRRPDKICPNCNKSFNSKSFSCSRRCSSKLNAKKLGKSHFMKMGQNSSKFRQRRSKNEIYLSILISKDYKILTNESIFNGWDADIIIPKLKLAILWNGIWHYKKVTEKHSLIQVENRDRIKLNEIMKAGYTPYVIRDMGRYNPKFVEFEYSKLKEFIKNLSFH